MHSRGEITLGTIIWADVDEPCGKPAGEHPCVVLTPPDAIAAGADLRVAVCTTSFSGPRNSGWFDVPTAPGGHPDTGLDQACVVKATWIAIVKQDAIKRVGKRMPARIYKQVRNWLADQEREMQRRNANQISD